MHGWPARHGGVSTEKRASLNLGLKWGDTPENVTKNLARVAARVGYDAARLRVTRHVHGTDIWAVEGPEPASGSYDGLATARVGDVLAAFAADCIPLLFADPVRRVVAAAHAGWRGTVANMAAKMVRTLTDAYGADPATVRVALGPSIGPCCFEVGPEVARAFEDALPGVPGIVVDGARKQHVDLRTATREFLFRAGVAPEHIDASPPCTCCHPERFFSYRRDGTDTGVHMGFIGLEA